MRNARLASTTLLSLVLAAGVVGCGEVAPVDLDAGPQPIDAPTGMATLTIDRNSADLGMVLVGQTSAATTFMITNTGTIATGALTATASGAGFAVTTNTCTGMTLAAGASCAVAVTATPTAPGPISGTVMAIGMPGGTVMASLTATGLAPGALMAMPGNFDFGVVPGGTMSPPTTITISNTGGAATGMLTGAIGGADAASFQVGMNGCNGMVLAAGASCNITVRMTPANNASGTKNATLTVMATPGGATTTMLTGTAQLPGVITLGGQNGAFGDVPLTTPAMPVVRTATVTNSGQQTTGPLMITRNGAASFSVLTGMAGDCVSGTTTLAGGASCNLRVQFLPSAAGAAVGSVTVSATPGGSQTLNLSANVLRPATLTANTNVGAFGLVEVNAVSTTSVAWTITNTGEVASTVPMFTASAEMDVSANTCTAALPAGGMCSMTLKFKPSAAGVRTGTAMVSIMGSSVMLNATATGGFRLTVTVNGVAGGVSSDPAGINCAPMGMNCSAVFAPGNVTLLAASTNGGITYFAGWGGAAAGACDASPNRTCTVALTANGAITASFPRRSFNLAFISSQTYPPNLGGTAPYDAACNALATAAGINNGTGDAYIAWMSDANSNAVTRLGAIASGWVRMDGRVVATARDRLLAGEILNPIRYTETGAERGDILTFTGTDGDGTTALNQHCLNWTTNVSPNGWRSGSAMGGPQGWTAAAGSNCANGNAPIICMMRQGSQTPTVTAFPGKKVWLTNAPHAISAATSPDTVCNASRPATAASGRALISRTTSTAASLLAANQMYVRPDGQEVGTGAEISTGQFDGGIWQRGNGTYANDFPRAWTGSTAMSELGTLISTCGNWSDIASAAGRWGIAYAGRNLSWNLATMACNTPAANSAYLYCYEP